MVNGSEQRPPETREDVEATGGEVADNETLDETGSDEQRRFGVTIERFGIEHVTGPDDTGDDA